MGTHWISQGPTQITTCGSRGLITLKTYRHYCIKYWIIYLCMINIWLVHFFFGVIFSSFAAWGYLLLLLVVHGTFPIRDLTSPHLTGSCCGQERTWLQMSANLLAAVIPGGAGKTYGFPPDGMEGEAPTGATGCSYGGSSPSRICRTACPQPHQEKGLQLLHTWPHWKVQGLHHMPQVCEVMLQTAHQPDLPPLLQVLLLPLNAHTLTFCSAVMSWIKVLVLLVVLVKNKCCLSCWK